jgi:hypothetical protein
VADVSGIVNVQGLPRDNASVKLFPASSFATPPVKGTAFPVSGQVGSTATSGDAHGGDGAYRFTSVPAGTYYAGADWNGTIVWDSHEVSADVEIPWVNVDDHGAVGDGVADDTAAFEAAVAALPAAGGEIVIPPGTYLVSSTDGITCAKSVTLTGAGIGATTITRGSASHALSTFSGSSSVVTMRGITWDGATWKKFGVNPNGIATFIAENCEFKRCGIPGYAAGNQGSIDGLRCDSVTRVKLDRCLFDSCERDGCLGIPIKYLEVTNCRFTNCGRGGCTNDRNGNDTPVVSTYVGNYVEDCGAFGLHTESINTGTLATIHYIGNTIIDCGDDDGWGIAWGLVFGNYTQGEAIGNTILETSLTGAAANYGNAIQMGGLGGPVSVKGNVIRQTRASGVLVNSALFPVSVEDNAIYLATTISINVYDSPRTRIVGNHCEDGVTHGIQLEISSSCVIAGNEIVDCCTGGAATHSGINVINCSALHFTDNLISCANGQYGFKLDDTGILHTWEMRGNRVQSIATAWASFANNTTKGDINHGFVRFYHTTTPAGAIWVAGDMVFKTNTAAGSPWAWVFNGSTWTPIYVPAGTTLTQTFSTADATHAARTSGALTLADGAGTNDGTIGAITADASVIAAVQELADQIGKNRADIADTAAFVNSIADILQAHGLAG